MNLVYDAFDIADPSSTQDACLLCVNLVYGLVCHVPCVAQWLESPTGVRKIIGQGRGQERGSVFISFQLRSLTHSAHQCDVTWQRARAWSRLCRLARNAIKARTTEPRERQNARLISLLFANLIVSV